MRVGAVDGSGVTIDDDLERSGAEGIADDPDWEEDMFEGASCVLALHVQVAMGVAGDLGGAHLLDGGLHLLEVLFSGLAQVHLVSFHHPAAYEGWFIKF